MNIFLGTWIKKEVVLAKGGGVMKLKFKRRAAGAQKVERDIKFFIFIILCKLF